MLQRLDNCFILHTVIQIVQKLKSLSHSKYQFNIMQVLSCCNLPVFEMGLLCLKEDNLMKGNFPCPHVILLFLNMTFRLLKNLPKQLADMAFHSGTFILLFKKE